MANLTLEQKIKRVRWWTLGLSILYFSIGAYLVSDGSKFDPSKAYELLKDTLTLTATFLAPVSAFVLFSDWREPYLEGKKDEIQTKLSALEFKIRKQIYLTKMDLLLQQPIPESTFKDLDKVLFDSLIEFKDDIKRLNRLGFSESEYVLKMDELHAKYNNLKELLNVVNHYRGNDHQELAEEKLAQIFSEFLIVEEMAKNMDDYKLLA